MNKRVSTTLAAISLAAFTLTGCRTSNAIPDAGTSPSAPSASTSSSTTSPVKLKTAATTVGDIVVNGEGDSLYVFDSDVKDSGKSACTGSCPALWPAVPAGFGAPVLEGVSGTTGSIATEAGTQQLTLNGLPLYLFSKDSGPQEIKGQGVKGVWWLLSPAGEKISTLAG